MGMKIKTDIPEGSPPHIMLLAWAQSEIQIGEVLSREEMAHIGALILMQHLLVTTSVEDYKLMRAKALEVFKKHGGKLPIYGEREK